MKNKWTDAVGKLYLRTVLCSVLGVVIYLSFAMLAGMFADKDGNISPSLSLGIDIVSLVFQLVLFVCFVYATAWDIGNRHRNAVQFGHMAEDRLFGLKAGLLASVPAIVSYVVLIADKAVGLWAGYAAVYRLGHLALYPVIVWCFGNSLQATTADIGWANILTAGLPLLVTPVVSAVGYRLGLEDIVLADRLVYKKSKK